MFFPVTEVLRPVTFQAPPPRPEHAGANLPSIVLLRSQLTPAAASAVDDPKSQAVAPPRDSQAAASGAPDTCATAGGSAAVYPASTAGNDWSGVDGSSEAPGGSGAANDAGGSGSGTAGGDGGTAGGDGGAAGGDGGGGRVGQDAGIGPQRRRMHLEMRFPSAAWGMLNITGPLLGWSYTQELSPAPILGVRHSHRLVLLDGSGPDLNENSAAKHSKDLLLILPNIDPLRFPINIAPLETVGVGPT